MTSKKKVSKKKVSNRSTRARAKASPLAVAPAAPKEAAKPAEDFGKDPKGAKRFIPLKSLAREVSVEANCNTRSKLRRVWRDSEDSRFSDRSKNDRWVFSRAEAIEAAKIIAGLDEAEAKKAVERAIAPK